MKLAVGLIGLLFAIGIIVMIMSKQLDRDKGTIAVGKQAEQQVNQMGGRDAEGTDVRKSFDVAEDDPSKMTGVIVTRLDKDSALEKFYGLKKGDIIVEINSLPVKGMASASEAKDFIADSYAHQQALAVVRDEQRVSLPLAAPVTPPPSAGANPAPAPPVDSRSPLQRQLDAIQKVPTH